MSKPQLYVIAGPNGAGKTTFAKIYLPLYAQCPNFVNADLIASGLAPFKPEDVALEAGKLLLRQIRRYADKKLNFGFETTLSGLSYLKFLNELKNRGYKIHLYFLWIPTVEIALARIRDRVKHGGHHIPDAVVKRRFARGIANLFHKYQHVVDSWMIFDNSELIPQVVATYENDKITTFLPTTFDIIHKQAGSA